MAVIFSDLDGTSLYKGNLSKFSIDTIRKFQKDHLFVVATGRNYHSAEKYISELNLKGACILSNGTEIIDFSDNTKVYLGTLSYSETLKISRILFPFVMEIQFEYEDKVIIKKGLGFYLYKLARKIIKGKKTEYSKEIIKEDGILKICAAGPFMNILIKLFKLLFKDYEVVRAARNWIEILPKGINKLQAIKYLINKYNLKEDDIYVFGDAGNDVSMLKYFKNSYCPIDGLSEAKHSAKHLCPSAKEDGVSKTISELFLK